MMHKLYCFFFLISAQLSAQFCQQVKDINTGAEDSNPNQFYYVNSKALFSADGGTGRELYTTDGTDAGTFLVKEVNPSGDAFDGNRWAVLNDKIYFLLDDGSNGAELWVSDGTTEGTTIVKDINTNTGIGQNQDGFIFAFNNAIFFAASDGINGVELWKSDGTNQGTSMLADINITGSALDAFQDPCIYNNEFYFSASASSAPTNYELYKSDGTPEGTVLVKEINPSGWSQPNNFIVYNSLLYFHATDGTSGRELWSTDGTTINTSLVKDINPGSGNGVQGEVLGTISSGLIFIGNNGSDGNELWISDGTAEGTNQILDINPGPGSFNTTDWCTILDDVVYFAANDNVHGNELWRSDGTSVGTSLLKDINLGSGNSHPYAITNINGMLVFTANNGANGTEPWTSDGSANGTAMLQDIRAGAVGSSPDEYILINGKIYFIADNGSMGNELWEITNSVLSITGGNEEKEINVYPIPTISEVILESTVSLKRVEIFNASGILVKQYPNSGKELRMDLSELNAGVYFVVLYDSEDSFTTKLIVKE